MWKLESQFCIFAFFFNSPHCQLVKKFIHEKKKENTYEFMYEFFISLRMTIPCGYLVILYIN